MYRVFIRKNKLVVTILLFVAIYAFINYTQPNIFYQKNGSLREFGINRKSRTVFPVWLFSIYISIISYLIVSLYLLMPKIMRTYR
jgi:hypothetical protein